jgi:hypothetical protein
MSNEKPKVFIFVNPDAKSTKILKDFIAKHIDNINKKMYVKIIQINKKNIDLVKQKGVTQAPTLIYGKKHVVNLENIIKVLTPPQESKDNFGHNHTSADELVHNYHDSILNTGEIDDEDDMSPESRREVIRQKMAAIQKRRPQMSEDVDSTHRLRGGRKLKAGNPKQTSFASDDDFQRAAGVDNIQSTPSQRYMDDADGEMILEDYYLSEAYAEGKKVGKVVSKRR